jgi:general secretion pathway protein G
MALVLKCTCGKLLDMDEQHHGERGQCPWCGNQFIVGEVIHSTTAVQTEATKSKIAVHDSDAAKRPRPDDVIADPQTAYPKPIHLLLWLLVFVGVFGVLPAFAYFLLQPMDGGYGKKDEGRTRLRTLTTACEAYSIKRGRFPKSLEDLPEKDELGGPYVRGADFLVDPWGRPYQYDSAGPRNNGLVPDIWTVAPDGTEIGNWPRGR